MKYINTAIAVALFGSATLIASVGATDGSIRGLQGQREKTAGQIKDAIGQIKDKVKVGWGGNSENGNGYGIGNGNGSNSKFFKASQNGIIDQYIVVFEDTVENQEVESLTDSLIAKAKYGKKLGRPFRSALKGFAAKLNEADAIALSERADVKYVEQDSVMYASAVTWGLDRIDQRDLPLSDTYSPGEGVDGSGVTAYIIDTGIQISHDDFGGRATWGTNESGDDDDRDCNGHGTHGT